MKKCSKCGEEIEDDSTFCYYCGKQVSTNTMGGVKLVEEEKGVVEQKMLCPFSWIEVTEPPGCLSGFFGGKGKLVWKPQPCMGTRCQLWDSAKGNCGLVTKES